MAWFKEFIWKVEDYDLIDTLLARLQIIIKLRIKLRIEDYVVYYCNTKWLGFWVLYSKLLLIIESGNEGPYCIVHQLQIW